MRLIIKINYPAINIYKIVCIQKGINPRRRSIAVNEIATLAMELPHLQLHTGNCRPTMIGADTVPVKAPPVKQNYKCNL